MTSDDPATPRTSAATMARIRVALARGLLSPGRLSEMDVAHDDDCPALVGHACTCQPDLFLTAVDGTRWEDRGHGWVLTHEL